jgi:hypothetical protein
LKLKKLFQLSLLGKYIYIKKKLKKTQKKKIKKKPTGLVFFLTGFFPTLPGVDLGEAAGAHLKGGVHVLFVVEVGAGGRAVALAGPAPTLAATKIKEIKN